MKVTFRGSILAVCFTVLLSFLGADGFALSSYLSAVKAKYPGITGTPLDDCGLCHLTPSNPSTAVNNYGSDLLNSGTNVAGVGRISNDDSDGDGSSNVKEFFYRTSPGDNGDVPAPPANRVDIVPIGSTWKHFANGTDPGPTWKNAGFSDTAWTSGPTQMGYGNVGESTVVSYGPTSTAKYATHYYRYAFNYPSNVQWTNLLLKTLRNDGVIVYLNGTEVLRNNMPAGAVTNTTLAALNSDSWIESTIDSALLVSGQNILAAEVHLYSQTSADCSFDMLLQATQGAVTVQTGSLQVAINPAAAVTAGAQWRRVGTTAWLNNGATETGIPVGSQTVEFKSVTGWNSPSNASVTILNGQTVSASGTYTQQTGSLQVTINPAAAVTAGAQWRRVGAASWINSGVMESGIVPGSYTVEFKAVAGWTAPANAPVAISSGAAATASGTYTPLAQSGSLQVTINPAAAVTAGAQWRRVGTTAWFNSGATESGIPVGTQTIEFKAIAGWTAPANVPGTITDGTTATTSGTYTQQLGSLQVTIGPAAAVTAGAQWRRVGTTTWLNSGATETGIAVGSQSVEFKAVAGWTTPANAAVTIGNGTTATASGTYVLIPQVGSLQVTISPAAAVTAGAQWRRVGTTTWFNSGATETGIAVGPQSVEFRAVTGWTTPTNAAVTIGNGTTATAGGTYVLIPQVGSLQVTIGPAAAVTAGAQWRRVGTTTWLNSGATETGIPVGSQSVEFKAVAGWTTPANAAVTIANGATATASGTYVLIPQVGSLQVTISPAAAITAGAQWRRVGTTAWLNSGATETGIPVGSQSVEFKAVAGWTAPANAAVTIANGATASAGGTYTQIVQTMGSVQVTIAPDAAVTAGAKWRRVGTTTWCDSGYTETGVPTGSQTIEFNTVAGWAKPANMSVTVSDGVTATASATYTEAPQTGFGSLRVTISPSQAASSGARWRRVGTQYWFKSGQTESRIPAGAYDVEFNNIKTFTKPGNQSVTITNGALTQARGVYTLILKARITSPKSGSTIRGSRVQVTAGVLQGSTEQVSRILFQYRAPGATAWEDIPAASGTQNPDSTRPWAIYWNTAGLPQGTCGLRAIAYDMAGQADPSPVSISVRIRAGGDDGGDDGDGSEHD